MQTFDVIVIGAGAMGSAAAYHLTKAGAQVLLLEQFELDHRWGSSYGQSRIIRYSYDVADYIALAGPNYRLWEQLEADAGEQLLIRTGGVDFGHADDEGLNNTHQSMQAMNIAHEVLSPEEANQRFPQFHFREDMKILYQADSGMLRASDAVKAHVRVAQRDGATFQSEEPVQTIEIHDDGVTVRTGKGSYSAGKLVVTVGGWAKRLLSQTGLNLPLEVLRCQLNFFAPHEQPDLHDVAQMPIFIYHRHNSLHEAMYGIPSYQETGVKAAFHTGEAKAKPEEVDYEPDADTVERVREAIGDHLPVVRHGALLGTRICLYTQTPDSHFIMDRHPAHPHVIIGAGFSGHGFKFSTLIGHILSDLALTGQTEHDIRLFRADRFG